MPSKEALITDWRPQVINFSIVHNIQADVPPENVIAMWEALQG